MSLRGDPEGENVKTLSVPSLLPKLEYSAPVLSEISRCLQGDSTNQRKSTHREYTTLSRIFHVHLLLLNTFCVTQNRTGTTNYSTVLCWQTNTSIFMKAKILFFGQTPKYHNISSYFKFLKAFLVLSRRVIVTKIFLLQSCWPSVSIKEENK